MWFRRSVLAAGLLLPGAFARAELPAMVKVGILNDMNGPFADQSGRGSVVAAQMAAEEFAGRGGGFRVEILSADHLNKPDVGAQIVREWVDRDGVDAVADAVNSSVGLAVNTVMAEKHRTFIATNVGTSDLTGKFCQPTTVQWTMDTYALGNTMARAMMAQHADTWFYISFDYALGAALERDSSAVLSSLGGKVVGSVKHPLGTSDFSSYLLRAQASGAKVIALADTGADLINAVKQAAEFGITRNQILAGLFTQIVDVKSIGLQAAQGLTVTEAFYWDLNEDTRALRAPLRPAIRRQDADGEPGRRLFIGIGVSERGEGRRFDRRRDSHRADAQAADRGQAVRHGDGAPGWPSGARYVHIPGEDSWRIEVAMGRLYGARPDSRHGRVPAAPSGRLQAGCELDHFQPDRAGRKWSNSLFDRMIHAPWTFRSARSCSEEADDGG